MVYTNYPFTSYPGSLFVVMMGLTATVLLTGTYLSAESLNMHETTTIGTAYIVDQSAPGSSTSTSTAIVRYRARGSIHAIKTDADYVNSMQVAVYYDSTNPDNASLSSKAVRGNPTWEQFIGPAILAIGGILLAVTMHSNNPDKFSPIGGTPSDKPRSVAPAKRARKTVKK